MLLDVREKIKWECGYCYAQGSLPHLILAISLILLLLAPDHGSNEAVRHRSGDWVKENDLQKTGLN